MSCDLHNHSVFSDGTLTPVELVKKAKEINLSAIALTDHNTTAGLNEFVESGKKYGVETVPGIEFSTEFEGNDFHIVALFIKETDFEKVNDYAEFLRKSKKQSNIETIENLRKAGYDITYEEVVEFSFCDNINRSNIAQLLVARNLISSTNEAFSTVLADDSPLYINAKKLDAVETIKFINSIGAVSVWAHPYFDYEPDDVEKYVKVFAENGLAAMETYYSTYDTATTELALKIANKYNLLSSGGSDFHGAGKPHIQLGVGMGTLSVPDEIVKNLKSGIV